MEAEGKKLKSCLPLWEHLDSPSSSPDVLSWKSQCGRCLHFTVCSPPPPIAAAAAWVTLLLLLHCCSAAATFLVSKLPYFPLFHLLSRGDSNSHTHRFSIKQRVVETKRITNVGSRNTGGCPGKNPFRDFTEIQCEKETDPIIVKNIVRNIYLFYSHIGNVFDFSLLHFLWDTF